MHRIYFELIFIIPGTSKVVLIRNVSCGFFNTVLFPGSADCDRISEILWYKTFNLIRSSMLMN